MSPKRLGLALRRMARQFAHGDAYTRPPAPTTPIKNPMMGGYGRGIHQISHGDHKRRSFQQHGLSKVANRRF